MSFMVEKTDSVMVAVFERGAAVLPRTIASRLLMNSRIVSRE
jgi:hypothetical protein